MISLCSSICPWTGEPPASPGLRNFFTFIHDVFVCSSVTSLFGMVSWQLGPHEHVFMLTLLVFLRRDCRW
jgi:hypothetical protein